MGMGSIGSNPVQAQLRSVHARTDAAGTQVAPTNKPLLTTNTDGAQVRITPSNFRQVLGPNSDVLLTPQNMKDMYEKGYLDVKKTRTTMESNEGTFTILAKALGAIIGPSRSIGAISIDPNFLEMIKDPNAKVGFGYTRVSNETIEVLPSPKNPPPPPDAVPPKMPPIKPMETPGRKPEPKKSSWDPVEMTKAQIAQAEAVKSQSPKIDVATLGTFDHDKPGPGDVDAKGRVIDDNRDGVLQRNESGIREKTQGVVDALKSGVAANAFTVTVQTNSNILRPPGQTQYNSHPTHGLSYRRMQSATQLIGLPGSSATQNGDAKHTKILDEQFHLNVVSSPGGKTKDGVTLPQKGSVMVEAQNPVDKNFANAANDLIATGTHNGGGVLQSNEDLLKPGATYPASINTSNPLTTRIQQIAEKNKLSPADTQKLFEYAQTFVDNRSFDAEVQVTDFDSAKKWVDANAGNPKVANTDIFKQVKGQVEAYEKGEYGLSPEQAQAHNQKAMQTITSNVDQLTSGTAVPMKEDIAAVRKQIADMRAAGGAPEEKLKALEDRLSAVESKQPPVVKSNEEFNKAVQEQVVKDLNTAAQPGTEIEPRDLEVIKHNVEAMGQHMDDKPAGPITVAGKVYNGPDTKPEDMKSWNDIVKDVQATANQAPPDSGEVTYDAGEVKAKITENLGMLAKFSQDLNNKQTVNPESVSNFVKGTQKEIAKLPQAEQKAFQDQLAAIMQDPKMQDAFKVGDRATALAEQSGEKPTEGTQISQSISDFHRYVKEVAADGQVSFEERDGMKNYVSNMAQQMLGTLKSRGLSFNETEPPERQLATVNPQMLKQANPPFEGAEMDQMVKNVESLKSAQAAVNLCSESTFSSSLYQNVRNLDKKLDDFEKIGVTKAAFRGEMKNLASETPPARFNALLSAAYGLPPCPEKREENPTVFDAYKTLQNNAKDGKLSMPPNVSFVDRSQLGGANGAYSNPTNQPGEGTILLARDLADQPDKMFDVFTEEMFHHLEHETSLQDLAHQGAMAKSTQADTQVSSLMGPMNNLREQLLAGDGLKPDDLQIKTGETGETAKERVADQIAPQVQTKVSAWLQNEMQPLLAKGAAGRADAETQLTAMLKNCGMNEGVAATRAKEMLTAGSDANSPLQLAPVSTADARTMAALMIDVGDKSLSLPKGRGPAGQIASAPPDRRSELTTKLNQAVRERSEGVRDQKGYVDSAGDEGRAGLYALRAIRGNRDMNAVKFEADRGRGETLKASSSQIGSTGKDDHGVALHDITDGSQTVLRQGSQMEFSSGDLPTSTIAATGDPSGAGRGIGGLNPNRSQARTMEDMPSSLLQNNLSTLSDLKDGLNANPPRSINPAGLVRYMDAARTQLQDLDAKKQDLVGKLQAHPNDPQLQSELDQVNADLNTFGAKFNEISNDPKIQAAYSQGAPAVSSEDRNAGFSNSRLSDNFRTDPNGTSVQASFDEKKGTGATIAGLMVDVLPKGLQNAGRLLMQIADTWKAKIQKEFASLMKPITEAENIIYGGGGPWDHDVSIGRPQNYEAGQKNHELREVTSSVGPPDYAKNAPNGQGPSNQQRAEEQRQADERRRHELDAQAKPEATANS